MSDKVTAQMIQDILDEDISYKPNEFVNGIIKEIDERINDLFKKLKNAKSNKEKDKIKPIISYGTTKVLEEEEKDYIRGEYFKLGFKVVFKKVKYTDPHEVMYSRGNENVQEGTSITLKINK